MIHRLTTRTLAAITGLIAAVALSGCHSADAQTQPRLLTNEEVTTLKPHLAASLIPQFVSDLQVDATQSFAVSNGTGKTINLVAVRYESNNPLAGNTSMRCGIYTLGSRAEVGFLPTLGYDWTETEFCGGLQAVGFLPTVGGEFPRVLLVYGAGTAHSSVKEPVVLDFSESKNAYAINAKLSQSLCNNNQPVTIAEMKREIAGRK